MSNIKAQATLLSQLIEEDRLQDAKEVVESLSSAIKAETKEKTNITDLSHFLVDFKDRLTGRKNDSIIPTWFKCIDDRVFGAVKWNIMTICARSWWGKTTLWFNIALNMCKKHKVWFISLEMTEEEMWNKVISNIANISNWTLTNNQYSNEDIMKVRDKWEEIKEILSLIRIAYDCFDIDSICATIEDMADEWCEVVFVDWLWMIEAKGNAQYEKIRIVMRELKRIATQKNVAIIAMQQLNRQMDWATRKPAMYDIADGSFIEKVSSPVLILWDIDRWYKEVSFFKTRRLNTENFRDKVTWVVDYDKVYNWQLKEELQYCRFVDVEDEVKEAKPVKPF